MPHTVLMTLEDRSLLELPAIAMRRVQVTKCGAEGAAAQTEEAPGTAHSQ